MLQPSISLTQISQPDPNLCEVLLRSESGIELVYALPIIERIKALVMSSNAAHVLVGIQLPIAGSDLGWIAKAICEMTQVLEFKLHLLDSSVREGIDIHGLGKLRELKILNVKFEGDIRIYEESPWTLICKFSSFAGDVEFLSKLTRFDAEDCTFNKNLFINGEVEKLSLQRCVLQDVKLTPYKLGQDSHAQSEYEKQNLNGVSEYKRQVFDKSTLRGTFEVNEVQSAKGCTLVLGGLKLLPGSRINIQRSAVDVDLRGLRIPSNCELSFESNEARILDLRYVEVSPNANLWFRNQPLDEFLSCGTILDRCTFSMVRFKRSGGHYYLADDISVTHLPFDYRITHGCPDASIPKVDRTDAGIEAVLTSYRQLIVYFDDTRDYRTAESLYYSEMRLTERESQKTLREKIGPLARLMPWMSLLWWYRILSRYGTSYARAGFWLSISLLVIFPLLFFCSGLVVKNPLGVAQNGGPSIVFTSVLWDSTKTHLTNLSTLITDYGYAVIYTFSIATLQKEEYVSPFGWGGIFFKTLVPPIILGQLALFLICLKRRFRRQG